LPELKNGATDMKSGAEILRRHGLSNAEIENAASFASPYARQFGYDASGLTEQLKTPTRQTSRVDKASLLVK